MLQEYFERLPDDFEVVADEQLHRGGLGFHLDAGVRRHVSDSIVSVDEAVLAQVVIVVVGLDGANLNDLDGFGVDVGQVSIDVQLPGNVVVQIQVIFAEVVRRGEVLFCFGAFEVHAELEKGLVVLHLSAEVEGVWAGEVSIVPRLTCDCVLNSLAFVRLFIPTAKPLRFSRARKAINLLVAFN